MSRLFFVFLTCVLTLVFAASAPAQVAPTTSTATTVEEEEDDHKVPVEEYYLPNRFNNFSLGLRYIGKARAVFNNVGTITTDRDAGNDTDEVTRTYDNGNVSRDTRTDDAGNDSPDDGTTNTWSYRDRSQATSDQSGINFNIYSSTTEGVDVSAQSGASAGLDMEYGRELGGWGRKDAGSRNPFTWGALIGFGLNDINVKTRQTIRASLTTLTDTYSLLGSPLPYDEDVDGDTDDDDGVYDDGIAYAAPSSTTETVTNPDGTETTITVDTTTPLANRPDNRTETTEAGAAEVDGYWQIKGAYFALRAGPWLRWQPTDRLSLRASAGAAVTWLGFQMRYDERLQQDNVNDIISETDETDTTSSGIAGFFSGLDAEWWLSDRTGFFGSAYYENFTGETQLTAGERSAVIDISSGFGLRMGVTTRF